LLTAEIDGQPAKRRGPKPDSKPALTRRQELNRQAQRTHRERKELYIKALEDEVLRLKEVYTTISQDKERLSEENRQLKQMITQNGVSMAGALQGGGSLLDDATSQPSGGYSGSQAGSFVAAPSSNTSAFTPPPLSAAVMGGQQRGSASPQTNQPHAHGHEHRHHGHSPAQRNPNVDYEQAGIDFVLTYDNNHPSKAYMSPPHQ
jgi:hypothetical protein